MGLQTAAFEGGLSETEPVTPLTFGDNPAEPLFDKGLQSCPLSMGQLASLLKEAIWYLYGCFHTANHIIMDIQASMEDIAHLSRRSRTPYVETEIGLI